MDKIAEAILSDGQKIQYVIKDNPPKGGMKHTYFAPDKSYVVQFYNDPRVGKDPNTIARIEAIIGRYNPTLSEYEGGARGNDETISKYFSKLYCWPYAIVKYPEFGIVCPTYPNEFFFNEKSSPILSLKGVDKKSNWFTSRNRKNLDKNELGDFRNMLQMSILLARAIRRMHQAGLAHSDLSNNNVLIDPQNGRCVVIDIDSLVVPGLYPPEVAGTPRYIAPEVLATQGLSRDNPNRKLPSTYTDLHALPVLIYEYLFLRHPLIGPKVYSTRSSEEDDYLALGSKATFIENPSDQSNRPKNLSYSIKDLGPKLERLFLRAFVEGLHSPELRPTAMEWERGLVETWDLIYKCKNHNCEKKWFILHNTNNPVCPFCKTRVANEELIKFTLKSESRNQPGRWFNNSEIVLYNEAPIFNWHIFSNYFPDEKADRELKAYVCKYNNKWILVNQKIDGLCSPSGNLVPKGQAILLENGTTFRLSSNERGMLAEVLIKKV